MLGAMPNWGAILVGLCAALTETFEEDAAAEILSEIVRLKASLLVDWKSHRPLVNGRL